MSNYNSNRNSEVVAPRKSTKKEKPPKKKAVPAPGPGSAPWDNRNAKVPADRPKPPAKKPKPPKKKAVPAPGPGGNSWSGGSPRPNGGGNALKGGPGYQPGAPGPGGYEGSKKPRSEKPKPPKKKAVPAPGPGGNSWDNRGAKIPPDNSKNKGHGWGGGYGSGGGKKPTPGSGGSSSRDGIKPPTAGDYVVKKGDNLWDITRKQTGAKSNADIQRGTNMLYERNRGVIGSNPNLIHPGQRLKMSPNVSPNQFGHKIK